MAPKKLEYVCYSTRSLYKNIWWREAGAKSLLNQEKHQKMVFLSFFFCIFLPDKLPNSKKTPENVVFEILGYIQNISFYFQAFLFIIFHYFFNPLKFAFLGPRGTPMATPSPPQGQGCNFMFESHYRIACNLTNTLKTFFSNFTPKLVKKPHFLPFFCYFLPFDWTKLYIWHQKNLQMFVTVPGHCIRTFGGERLRPNIFSTKKNNKKRCF